jgi:ABC-type transporter Mla subunit MlaD
MSENKGDTIKVYAGAEEETQPTPLPGDIIGQARAKIAAKMAEMDKLRDELRELHDELDSLVSSMEQATDSMQDAVDALDRAADAMSQFV